MYYNSIINEEELRELSIRPSKKALVVETLSFCLPLVVVIPVLIIFVVTLLGQYRGLALVLGGVLFFVIGLMAAILLLFEQKRLRDEHYLINQTNVETINRTFGSRHCTYGLKGMTSMAIEQNFLAKIFDYGTITLKFMGGGICELKHIQDPETVMAQIQELMAKGKLTPARTV